MTEKKTIITLTDEREIAIFEEYSNADQEARDLAPPDDPIYPSTNRLVSAKQSMDELEKKYQEELDLNVPLTFVYEPITFFDKEEEESSQAAPAKESALELQTANCPMPAVPAPIVPVSVTPANPATMANSTSVVGMYSAQQTMPQSSQTYTFAKARKPIAPSAMELKEELLAKVSLKRIQETVYAFNNRYYYRLTTNDLETLIHNQLRSLLSITGDAHQIKNVVKLVTTEARIIAQRMDDSHGLLNVGNGVYDISHDTLTVHTPDLFFTSIIDVYWVPGAECPAFDRYLQTVTGGDPAMISRFWQAIGYALVPDNRGKRFLYLHGVSQSGKTVLCDVLASFFPEDAVSSVSTFDLGRSFGYAGLVEKRLNICSELPNGILNDEAAGKIKAITGGDTVEVNEKYKAQYKARLDCKLVFASNFPIRLTTTDDAFAQRCLELSFPNAIPAHCRDRFLKNKLLQERPGILYKAIQAYRSLIYNNYIFSLDDVISPAIIVSSQSATTPHEDLSAFLQTVCIFDPQLRVTTKGLFSLYNQLRQTHSWKAFKDERDFGFHLSSLVAEGYPQVEKQKFRPAKNENPVNGYIGMGLRD